MPNVRAAEDVHTGIDVLRRYGRRKLLVRCYPGDVDGRRSDESAGHYGNSAVCGECMSVTDECNYLSVIVDVVPGVLQRRH